MMLAPVFYTFLALMFYPCSALPGILSKDMFLCILLLEEREDGNNIS